MPLYTYACDLCRQERDVFHRMSETPVIRCRYQHRMRRTLGAGTFFTPKDKRYEFVTQHVEPGTVIRSKGQWERFLRQHKLTDDLSPKEQAERARTNFFEKKQRERHAERLQHIRRDLRQAAADRSLPLRQFPEQRKAIERAFADKS